jgi:uncharacterized membrane protein
VVGVGRYSQVPDGEAFVWDSVAGLRLLTPQFQPSDARDINNSGQIIGTDNSGAVIWSGTVPTPIGPGMGWAINDGGGAITSAPGTYWNGAGLFQFSNFVSLSGISNNGWVAGNEFLGSLPFTAPFVWSASTGFQYLGDLPGGYSASATGVNNARQVIGVSNTPLRTWGARLMGSR